jgi:glucose/arabinose dehydrogenase
MHKSYAVGIVIVVGALLLAPAAAQSTPDVASPKQFRVASSDPNMRNMPQTGRKADAIRENLKWVKLPPGFKIELYAVVPNARHMAVAPAEDQVFVGTRKNTVWIVPDPHGGEDGDPDEHHMPFEVKAFAPSLNFKAPDGVCFTSDGFLTVVEENRILTFSTMEFFDGGPKVTVVEVVPQGQLVPVKQASPDRSERACRVGTDKKLYVALGGSFNASARERREPDDKSGIGGIIQLAPFDGRTREVYTRGVRNAAGLAFNPKDNTLWFIDNRSNGATDDGVAGEINRATAAGQFFGNPSIQAKTRSTDIADKDPLPPNVMNPQVKTDAHVAFLGLTFYGGYQFPQKYRGGLFSVQHGSSNQAVSVGTRIMFTSLKADGTADKTELFATFDDKTHRYRGRPVDVAHLHDGSLLVSDEFAGAIYRIFYTGR